MTFTGGLIVLLIAGLLWQAWELRREQRHTAALEEEVVELDAELGRSEARLRRAEEAWRKERLEILGMVSDESSVESS